MSEPLYGDDRIEALLKRSLSAPVPTDPARKRRIMELVRQEAATGDRRPATGAPTATIARASGVRRGWTTPAFGGLMAAALAGLMVMGAPRLGTSGGGMRATLGDSAVATALRDTLRLVQFVLVAPTASRVALVGEFNGWRREETLLAADDSGRWRGAVRLAPGAHRYAFVVDDTQWVADPAARGGRDSAGRPTSLRLVGGE